MHYKSVLLTLFFLSKTLFSEEQPLTILPYKKNIKERILEGEVFSESTVNSFNYIHDSKLHPNTKQSLHFSIAGLHPKSCQFALKTLSLYENYSQFLGFVQKSQYDQVTNKIRFTLSSLLLPYDMILTFTLPRITTPGLYPFTFDAGILKNLHGNIHVIGYSSKEGDRCLFYSYADWSGPHTGINDTVFELFSQVLSKLSMEMLFRISKSLNH